MILAACLRIFPFWSQKAGDKVEVWGGARWRYIFYYKFIIYNSYLFNFLFLLESLLTTYNFKISISSKFLYLLMRNYLPYCLWLKKLNCISSYNHFKYYLFVPYLILFFMPFLISFARNIYFIRFKKKTHVGFDIISLLSISLIFAVIFSTFFRFHP